LGCRFRTGLDQGNACYAAAGVDRLWQGQRLDAAGSPQPSSRPRAPAARGHRTGHEVDCGLVLASWPHVILSERHTPSYPHDPADRVQAYRRTNAVLESETGLFVAEGAARCCLSPSWLAQISLACSNVSSIRYTQGRLIRKGRCMLVSGAGPSPSACPHRRSSRYSKPKGR
jgi:hypothetical protein